MDDQTLINGLLAERQMPPSSEQRPAMQRVRWFRTFAMNVSQVYDEDGDGPPAKTIRLEEGRDE